MSPSSIFAQTPPFLKFPLPNRDPFSARINSVFDHSFSPLTDRQYCPDDVVIAFTGEEGRREFGTSSFSVDFGCGTLQAFRNSSRTNFTLGEAEYSGGSSGAEFLSYDGHPGYDFRTTDQNSTGRIDVLAAAAGTVVCVSLRLANGAAMERQENVADCESPSFGQIKIDHGNGYFTSYLHLSSAEVHGPRPGLQGDTVVARQRIGTSGDTGVRGAPHLHFEVRREISGVGVPVDPYGWEGSGTDPYTRAANVNLWSTLLGDLNRDSIVNSLDWALMNSKWLTNDARADLNNDGIVNSLDFSLMNANWLQSLNLTPLPGSP